MSNEEMKAKLEKARILLNESVHPINCVKCGSEAVFWCPQSVDYKYQIWCTNFGQCGVKTNGHKKYEDANQEWLKMNETPIGLDLFMGKRLDSMQEASQWINLVLNELVNERKEPLKKCDSKLWLLRIERFIWLFFGFDLGMFIMWAIFKFR